MKPSIIELQNCCTAHSTSLKTVGLLSVIPRHFLRAPSESIVKQRAHAVLDCRSIVHLLDSQIDSQHGKLLWTLADSVWNELVNLPLVTDISE
jgi:hypothetical protein